MSARRALATVAMSAALSLAVAAPAHARVLPEPGPRVPTSTPSTPVGVPSTPPRLAAAVEVSDVMGHLEAFQSIADAHAGTRAAGTAGHAASAAYVESRLADSGYRTWRDTFTFTYEETHSSSLTYTVAGTTSPAGHLPMAQSPAGAVSGPLAMPSGRTTGCAAADWSGLDATDRVALVVRGGCTFAAKAQAAADAGATAVLVANDAPGTFVGALGGHPDTHLPTVSVTQETGRRLADLPADATLSLAIDKTVEERETFTVLAERTGARAEDVVMLGAHLDSGADGPGINDNATGSAVLLETARRLAGAPQTRSTVRFAWWGGAHLDNLGSRHYLDHLAADEPEGLERIGIYLDVDTVASPNHVIGVQDPDGAGSVLTEHLDSLGRGWVETSPPADSDARAFLDRGIPSTGLSTGTTGTKSGREVDLFGGTEGLPYDPNHDTVADDLDNVDVEVLRTTTAAVAHATERLASRR